MHLSEFSSLYGDMIETRQIESEDFDGILNQYHGFLVQSSTDEMWGLKWLLCICKEMGKLKKRHVLINDRILICHYWSASHIMAYLIFDESGNLVSGYSRRLATDTTSPIVSVVNENCF